MGEKPEKPQKAPVEKKQKEDKPDEEESPDDKKRGRPKREAAAKEPSPKKAKGKNAKAEPVGIALDDAIVAAAEKAGFGAQLRNLATRAVLVAKGCEGKALLKALQS